MSHAAIHISIQQIFQRIASYKQMNNKFYTQIHTTCRNMNTHPILFVYNHTMVFLSWIGVHTYTHTYIHTCIHIYIYIYIYIHTYIHPVHYPTRDQLNIHTYMHAYIYTYIHACIHVHTYIYI